MLSILKGRSSQLQPTYTVPDGGSLNMLITAAGWKKGGMAQLIKMCTLLYELAILRCIQLVLMFT